jgi:hypothetical protein
MLQVTYFLSRATGYLEHHRTLNHILGCGECKNEEKYHTASLNLVIHETVSVLTYNHFMCPYTECEDGLCPHVSLAKPFNGSQYEISCI